jgi:ketosteroid isomerase-like protein
MVTEHPARAAANLAMSAVERGAKSDWLALFADDATFEDPVGVSFLDPEGKGHRGKAEISAFWDQNIARGKVKFDIHHSYAAGNEVANTGTLTVRTEGDVITTLEATILYRVNKKGKLVSVRAFWEVDKMNVSMPSR